MPKKSLRRKSPRRKSPRRKSRRRKSNIRSRRKPPGRKSNIRSRRKASQRKLRSRRKSSRINMSDLGVSVGKPIYNNLSCRDLRDLRIAYPNIPYINRAYRKCFDDHETLYTAVRIMLSDNIYAKQGIIYQYGNMPYWDTSLVTDMKYLFYGANGFNENISRWDTSLVTNMTSMFHNAVSFNQPLGRWNTENVISMRSMFSGALAFNNGDVSEGPYALGNWNTRNVRVMDSMFFNARSFNQNISTWRERNPGVLTTHMLMFDACPISEVNKPGFP
jgi:surface protein